MYELTEDQLIVMKFLSGNGRTIKELLDFRASEKIWNDSLTTTHLIELKVAGFIDDSDRTIMKLNQKGEAVLANHINQQRITAEEKDMNFRKLQYDFRISKFTYWTYWIVFAISIAAFTMSLISLLRK